MAGDGVSLPRAGAAAWLKRAFVACSVATLLGAVALVPHFKDSAELVRMRNALLLDDEPAAHDWTPDHVPDGFALERAAPNPLYVEIVAREGLRVDGQDWETALAIARHLLAHGGLRGTAIQSDLDDSYRRITADGIGYCGDFADVFTGLANAAGLFSRPWAFSFDGFGGQGHIFNEVWDRAERRWIMLDVFNNIYFADPSGRPLSAAALRDALVAGEPVVLVPIEPAAAPGFKYEDKALEYYRRGLAGWYMWWGNNVFENDQAPLVRALGSTHRALEQLGGIAAGVSPRVRILHDDANRAEREALSRLRLHLHVLAASAGLALAFGAATLLARRRAPRSNPMIRFQE